MWLAVIANLAAGRWLLATVVLLFAILLPLVGFVGARMRTIIDSSGVTYYGIRKVVVPVGEIASVEVKPVAGVGSGQRAEAAIVRHDGTVLALDTTLVVNSGPDHRELLAVITQIKESLGLN
ncbi:MAG: hypothetical protein NVSMB48_23030 [Marmoricola sp.]